MASCVNHPDRETVLVCTKYSRHLCEACAHCSDPKLYCKFRTACMIWFMEKENNRQEKANQDNPEGDQ